MPDTPVRPFREAVDRLNAQQTIARTIGEQLRAEDEQRAAQTPSTEVPK